MRKGTQKKLKMELMHSLATNFNTQQKQKKQIFYWKESV